LQREGITGQKTEIPTVSFVPGWVALQYPVAVIQLLKSALIKLSDDAPHSSLHRIDFAVSNPTGIRKTLREAYVV